ncbi:hypothetical protein [Paenibacillus sp. FSL R7-0331]|uniref:hypothetical protein n=1 Tax=Paenibacillus sp. FSL R7-0331 TaxID=1536773 RepID=UPI0004F904BF|nr:hypothetical protein [Paenibacillus sp. FSL R7-0331]AIQ53420.1 hypothetical protein R70331_19020 [Paenibacillus sp. FSL R7-0331]
MAYFTITLALILISVLAGVLVSSNIQWIARYQGKVVSINMGILLTFTILELIPSAIEFSHEGLIFVVLGILIPILFHLGHQHNEELDSSASLKFLFIGAAIHSFFDGSIITTALLMEDQIATVIISSMLLHKVTEVIMLSLLFGTMLENSLRLLKYLVSLSFFLYFRYANCSFIF